MAFELLRSLTPDEWEALLPEHSSNGVEPQVVEDLNIVPLFPSESKPRKKRKPYTRSVIGALVERLYTKEQKPLREVGKIAGIPVREVKAILRKRGVAIRRHKVKKSYTPRGKPGRTGQPRRRPRAKLTVGRPIQLGNEIKLMDDQAAIELYKETPNLTIRELSKVSGINYWHLRNIIADAGVHIRRPGRPKSMRQAVAAG